MSIATLTEFHTTLDAVKVLTVQSALSANAYIDAWKLANPLPGTSFQYAEITVPTASILTLNATPYTLVAAPGAGYVVTFHGAQLILDYAGTAYAGIGGTEDLAIRYTDGSGAIVSTTLETTGLMDATTDQLRSFKPITTDLTPVANAALVLHMLNGEITTGTSPLRLKVSYMVHATGL